MQSIADNQKIRTLATPNVHNQNLNNYQNSRFASILLELKTLDQRSHLGYPIEQKKMR